MTDHMLRSRGADQSFSISHSIYRAAFPVKKWLRYAILVLGVLALFGTLLTLYIGTHLVVEDPLQKADIIVLLGGDTSDRAPIAAILYFEGWAPKVLISGLPGECEDNARLLIERGVPREAIIFDDKSTSTQTNGLNCSKIINDLGLHKIILVTSWYHSSRSCRIFRKYLLSDIAIVSIPSATPQVWTVREYQDLKSEILKSYRNWALFGIPVTYGIGVGADRRILN